VGSLALTADDAEEGGRCFVVHFFSFCEDRLFSSSPGLSR